ncbi:hypothetical protein BCR39DRAFT_503031 [Naematelia encephala]|uniref:BZIP domain-containing protein n=1 Tax=Naematelia encephala TaxID=71784 RepID=A0A1Y2BM69_9TREE|nr:hypothetical protein BCR39DRAFT_503031 [Naematelia encephala]
MAVHSSTLKKTPSSPEISFSVSGYRMNTSSSMNTLMHGSSGAGSGLEDGDNRTRNAKAQRRHREKRKAHLKALEESVQLLTAQLEDARRQLGQAAFASASRIGNAPMSPQSKDIVSLQAENAYLREENTDLRRQLYTYRVSYGQVAPPHPGQMDGGEVKSEPGGFGVTYGQSSMASPRAGERLRQSGEYAPAASPYIPSAGNFPDPRSTSMSGQSPSTPLESRYTPVRYESHMYPPSAPAQPPPHQLPRQGLYDLSHQYRGGGGGGGDENPAEQQHNMWGPEDMEMVDKMQKNGVENIKYH